MPLYVKGVAVDYDKVYEAFAPRLKERAHEAYNVVIETAREENLDLVLAQSRNGEERMPHVLVLASDYDKEKLEATPVEMVGAGDLERFLEEKVGVFEMF
jgi:hypothetical protein